MQRTREPNEDCFAYSKTKNKCKALCDLICTYKNCTFYKPKEEIDMAEVERDIRNYTPTTENKEVI